MIKCERCQDSGWDTSLYREPVHCTCRLGQDLKEADVSYITQYRSLDLSHYQKLIRETYRDLEVNSNLTYPVLGMMNEAGEFAGKFKKIFRDKGGVIDEETREALRDELGDVFWYLTQICTNLGYSLDDLAEANLKKVLGRKARGTIHGNGDNR